MFVLFLWAGELEVFLAVECEILEGGELFVVIVGREFGRIGVFFVIVASHEILDW